MTQNTFQVQRFSTGDFCINKIVDPDGCHKGTLNAWFTASGIPTDAEQFIPHARAGLKTRPVRKSGKIWDYLTKLGKRHAI